LALEGEIVGATLGAASGAVGVKRAIVTTAKIGGVVARVAVDKKSGEDFKYVGGAGSNKKNGTDVVIDSFGEGL